MNKDLYQCDTNIEWETPFSLMLLIIVITPALVVLSSILIAYNIVLMHLPGFHQPPSRSHATTGA